LLELTVFPAGSYCTHKMPRDGSYKWQGTDHSASINRVAGWDLSGHWKPPPFRPLIWIHAETRRISWTRTMTLPLGWPLLGLPWVSFPSSRVSLWATSQFSLNPRTWPYFCNYILKLLLLTSEGEFYLFHCCLLDIL
jgi:hypothetical protein